MSAMKILSAIAGLILLSFATNVRADALSVKDAVSGPTDFPLVVAGKAAEILTDKDDATVVRIAAGLLAHDIEQVTGVKPNVSDVPQLAPVGFVVIAGTLGKNALIADLIKRGKLDVKSVEGKWESYAITTVTDPFPGVTIALVVVGSDRRGTAYGLMDLSEAIGVSPWVWWADVAPLPRKNLVIPAVSFIQGTPSVKYRGIFINDEDWGIQPWAAKTFEPEVGSLGPKTYAKVFELLLRLKANYIWPAMHECTRAFNSIPENKRVADDYAIVVGSSHAEPMLFNNATEWTLPKDHWNYETHADEVKAVWEKRIQETGKYESSYTIGIRGIHDRPMQGGKTTADRVKLIERVFADQRDLIARYVNPNVESVFQIFVPYKEVLPLYQNGLKVPDDVTLVWVDDNHGYIRRLSSDEERKRRGGSGVYYHLSYWGKPEDYLWLDTTPPALIWEEMHKAYENDARAVWVVNVGDIKMSEPGMEFFLRLAWNVDAWDENSQMTFLKQWAAQNFGSENASEIAEIMDEFYRLNFCARPEHLHLTQFSENYGEIERRLDRFAKLVSRTDAIYAQLPPERRDAFYQLTVYPVRGAALANQMHLAHDADKAMLAYEQIQAETKFFNEKIAGGKWRNVLSSNPRNRPALRKPDSKPQTASTNSPSSEKETPDADGIAFEAEKPSRMIAGRESTWKVIPGLGRSGDCVALLPTTAPVDGKAALQYEFSSPQTGEVKILVYCIPTLPLNSAHGMRYSAAIDEEASKEVSIATKEFDAAWSANVIRGAAIGSTNHSLAKAGRHTITIRPLDPGLVFDKIVVDFGHTKPSQLGPPAK